MVSWGAGEGARDGAGETEGVKESEGSVGLRRCRDSVNPGVVEALSKSRMSGAENAGPLIDFAVVGLLHATIIEPELPCILPIAV